MIRETYSSTIIGLHGRKSFANVFNDRREFTLADFPLKITAVSLEGGEQMKKIFIKTDTHKNKIRMFFTHVMQGLKRFCIRPNKSY